MKKAVRIFLITLGICAGLFLLIGLPLLTNIWGVTIACVVLTGVTYLIFGIVRLIHWAWSKD